MPRQSTSIDVAKRAGVSQSTVSRVFSGNSPNVSDAVRKRVLRAAQELNYHPNAIARMMSNQQTNIVGIVMANITNVFYPYVLEKFLQSLQTLGRQSLLFTPPPDHDVDALLPLILQYKVDALIVTSATISSDMASTCANSGTPVILFNRYSLGTPVSAVCADNVNGGRQAADLLLDTGHRRIGYVAGTANTSTNLDREKGFGHRLRERGLENWQRAQGDFTYDSGYHAALELFRSDTPPDGIFCANDIMAIGAIDAARSIGLTVPQAVSIIGFDDVPMAAWGNYNLTTIRQDVDAMIKLTIDLMLERLAAPDTPPSLKFVPVQLQIRDSVRGLTSQDKAADTSARQP